MKSIIVLVLSFFLLYGMFIYATFDREERKIDLESQNIHTIICMDGDGTRTYHINIPAEVGNREKFCEGFCDSIKRYY